MKTLNHVGIAVNNIEDALEYWRDALGLELLETREVASENVRVAFLAAGAAHIELLEPTSAASSVARFLARRGEGVHHLCFDSDPVHETIECLRAAGAQLLDDRPRAVGVGKEAAFVHPKSGNGVLVELYGTESK